MEKPSKQKETDIKLKIIKKDDGHSYLIYDSKEYIIGNRNDIEFGSEEIPRIRMDQIPDEIQFKIIYRDVIIFSPNRYTSDGTVCIVVIGEEWDKEMNDDFGIFMRKNPLFGGVYEDDLSGNPFIGMKMPGETLDEIFANSKKLIDDFLSQHKTL